MLLQKIIFIAFLASIFNGCTSWISTRDNVAYFEKMSSSELRERLEYNDYIIEKSYSEKGVSKQLQESIYDTLRIYSGCFDSPAFNRSQIKITSQKAISFFNPGWYYIFVSKDDLAYFNIHGVLIHESVGHPSDNTVYPLYRIFDIATFSSENPIHLWELRAISCVSAVWEKLHRRLKIPYKPWNILHPVAGSIDCEDVFDWFYLQDKTWKKAQGLTDLKKIVAKENTDSVPHLLARIYLLILSTNYDTQRLWEYCIQNNSHSVEKEIDSLIKKYGNVENALSQGLQKKYTEYLKATKLNLKDIAKLMQKQVPRKSDNLKVYTLSMGNRGIEWYDNFPYGLSYNDQITWHFSHFDSFEDQGADGPNHEKVLTNQDCAKIDYEKIWQKCYKLSEFMIRNYDGKNFGYRATNSSSDGRNSR